MCSAKIFNFLLCYNPTKNLCILVTAPYLNQFLVVLQKMLFGTCIIFGENLASKSLKKMLHLIKMLFGREEFNEQHQHQSIIFNARLKVLWCK